MSKSNLKVTFPGNLQVAVSRGDHSLITDQPVTQGGDGEAMSPFSLFLASIAACAGYYALVFCQKRNISTEGLELSARPQSREGTFEGMEIKVKLPEDFPERYQGALLRAIDQCTVKRAIRAQPEFSVVLEQEKMQPQQVL